MAENELKVNITKTGTCTVGIVCKDGIVVGADKRMSFGDSYIISHQKADKIVRLMDNIVVTTAGNASDIQFVVKLTRAELKLKAVRTKTLPSVHEAANLFASILYQQIRQFSVIPAISHYLIAGNDERGFHLFEATPDGCVWEHKNFVTSGAFGSMFIWTLLKEKWRDDLSIEEGKALAIKVLKAAIDFDASVGEPLNIVVIDKKGIGEIEEHKVSAEDKTKAKAK